MPRVRDGQSVYASLALNRRRILPPVRQRVRALDGMLELSGDARSAFRVRETEDCETLARSVESLQCSQSVSQVHSRDRVQPCSSPSRLATLEASRARVSCIVRLAARVRRQQREARARATLVGDASEH